jgi:hypothetical protein
MKTILIAFFLLFSVIAEANNDCGDVVIPSLDRNSIETLALQKNSKNTYLTSYLNYKINLLDEVLKNRKKTSQQYVSFIRI